MEIYGSYDPIGYELDKLRTAGEAEEAKHDCKGCRDRVGIPCLIAKSCKKFKTEGIDNGKDI